MFEGRGLSERLKVIDLVSWKALESIGRVRARYGDGRRRKEYSEGDEEISDSTEGQLV